MLNKKLSKLREELNQICENHYKVRDDYLQAIKDLGSLLERSRGLSGMEELLKEAWVRRDEAYKKYNTIWEVYDKKLLEWELYVNRK